ncbi:hypothetical protein K488DRAFT_70224 [Vararia minispora EC-137]|uniref:Uncharacterized protein n=1 Tax=Vararia minispora EC-137 TaxID=1314806 RepID=A0ACB8QMC5_9AGAM|nr:hypothetical protein K488DRAFT_70224 [Vararia minispora EC-137]
MRHISMLSDEQILGRDQEFHFRARAKRLIDKWSALATPKVIASLPASDPMHKTDEGPRAPTPPLPTALTVSNPVGSASTEGVYPTPTSVFTSTELGLPAEHELAIKKLLSATPSRRTEVLHCEPGVSSSGLTISSPPSPQGSTDQVAGAIFSSEDFLDLPLEMSGSHADLPGDFGDDEVLDELFDTRPNAMSSISVEEDDAWVLVDMVMESVRLA